MADGFDYDGAALHEMVQSMRNGASYLGDVAAGAPPSPDAGSSSGLVAQVLAGLTKSGAAAAARLDDMADKVHADHGAYDTTENNNKGEVQRGMRRYDHLMENYNGPMS